MVAADVFVVPSRWEGFGSILVEAMALGTTLVASDVGPVPDVVGSGWARLVPPDQAAPLADGRARGGATSLPTRHGDGPTWHGRASRRATASTWWPTRPWPSTAGPSGESRSATTRLP